ERPGEHDSNQNCATSFHEILSPLGIPGARIALPIPTLLFLRGLALILEYPDLVLDAMDWKDDLPRPGKDFGIGYCGLVADRVSIRQCVTLGHAHLVAVIVTGQIEPGAVIVPDDIYHQRVPFPMSTRIAHPGVNPGVTRVFRLGVHTRKISRD